MKGQTTALGTFSNENIVKVGARAGVTRYEPSGYVDQAKGNKSVK